MPICKNIAVLSLVASFVASLPSPSAPPRDERQATETDDTKIITLAVITPSAKPYLFRTELVQPAIEYAVESVRSEVASLGYKFKIAYRESHCSRRAAIAAVDLYYGDDAMYNRSNAMKNENGVGSDGRFEDDRRFHRRRKRATRKTKGDWPSSNAESRNRDLPLVFIGPVCNEAASVVATFAENWNVPQITSGAPAAWIMPGPNYPTLTRVGSSHFDLAHFIAKLFHILGYGTRVPVHLLYQDTTEGVATERECYFVMQAIYHIMNQNPTVRLFGPTYILGEFDEYRIASDMGHPKVVLMCATSDIVRRIMIGAYKTGYADPNVNHWYAIDLHNSTHYARGAWKAGDQDDDVAREAFKALLLVSVYARNKFTFNSFRARILKEYEKAGISEEINEFVVGFHDAIILYAEAMRRTIQQGVDIRDGLAVTRNMRNVTINGIAGPVVMGQNGDRDGDFSILAMTDFKAGTFSSVYDYLGTFEAAYNHGLPRLDFSRPGNNTLKNSGVNIEEILAEARREKARLLAQSTAPHEILAGVLGTLGGIVLCCALIFGPMCYQRRRRSRSPMSENGNGFGAFLNGNSDQVSLHRPLREECSVATCATILEDEPKL